MRYSNTCYFFLRIYFQVTYLKLPYGQCKHWTTWWAFVCGTFRSLWGINLQVSCYELTEPDNLCRAILNVYLCAYRNRERKVWMYRTSSVYEWSGCMRICYHSLIFISCFFPKQQWLYHSSGFYWFHRWRCWVVIAINEGNHPEGTSRVISHGYSNGIGYGNRNGSKFETFSSNDKYLIEFFR